MTDAVKSEARRPYAPRMTPADRREQLLDAVLRVVVERGVHKVSIESVAEAAGVTRPVVYKHFDDSAALLRASLAREEGRALAQCYAAGARAKEQVVEPDFVVALYANLLEMFEASPDLWSAILQLVDSATPEFRRTVERGRDQAAAMVADVVTANTDTGVGGGDPELYARMIVALVIESGRLLLARPDVFPRERLVLGAREMLARLR
ncbi:Transcriptional regulator, TetR family OS=Tsukamurella paurometabola (strain ATCC 8368 / DSM/ CCUG 35730 / CIP 100753 / JCM 10117 / KCTC 9821 / NBRC 16120/ NCIMB 702349 / NCTC 13040) OX=521096 GN=Tpau_0584 PE=4 SV=1 [Tsukamurella paurometabola]|uniref:Transcriptional regulator, TetR family n=2 Tax=Tsukamurella paurometabola TaxID=2061 RepID=D5UST5_TSUPD|nr:transcriptional regulator, TetR family [Tsukamurella paurometabola DSM 20162]SUP43203.1 Toluene efflux pump ttgABC operon repressor [Tsukamurella paurometabola]